MRQQEGIPLELNALKGSFTNIEYALPNGQIVKFWDDNKIYLGNQLHKKDSDRCYGIIADAKYLMVSEYSGFGADAEIVVFKQWNDAENKFIGTTCIMEKQRIILIS